MFAYALWKMFEKCDFIGRQLIGLEKLFFIGFDRFQFVCVKARSCFPLMLHKFSLQLLTRHTALLFGLEVWLHSYNALKFSFSSLRFATKSRSNIWNLLCQTRDDQIRFNDFSFISLKNVSGKKLRIFKELRKSLHLK